ncbi:MAG: hypothetical protein JSV49_02510 [Thermoplasmata archaeon]|nr:MAG: hypothetical protein JSV49_02510 [Thermoplasmata archaeon]
MDKSSRTKLLYIIVSLIIAGALIGSAVLLNQSFEEEESAFTEQEQRQFETAEVTHSIPKADSDYYDRNNDGQYEDGIDIPTPDGLSDIEEIYQYGTDVSNPDTDGDGMEDGWEAFFSRDPTSGKWRINPRTGRLAIDPNFKDANEDPDNDGFDVNGDGRYTYEENLTNLKEYCGGVIFEGHNPFDGENDEADLRFIRSHGGFHMAWSLEKTSAPHPLGSDWDPEYNREQYAELYNNKYYNNYNPYKSALVSTDPTDRDTDDDRMYDGWELYYQNLTRHYTHLYGLDFNDTLDPMDPSDAKDDVDIKKTDDTIKGLVPDEEYEPMPDGLTNLEEFENKTNPVLWDSDDDTFYDPGMDEPGKDPIYRMDDRTELTMIGMSCVSNTDWTRTGEYDNVTNPNDPDTDGDYMSDGFEIFFGLCPLNSSDRFLDLDNDGLLNYLEYRFPETGNQWFRTDPNDPDTDGDGIPDGWEAINAQVIQEYWWTYDTAGNEIKIVYEYGRQHHIEKENIKYIKEQDLDRSDGILDRHWYNFSVNPMVADSHLDLDGIWYDDPDIIDDFALQIKTEVDGDNDTIPDFHPSPDNLTNMLEWNGTLNFTGDYYEGLTDPNNPDTDGDGLTDGDELLKPIRGKLIGGKWFDTEIANEYYFTNPTLADSDQDFDPTNLSRSLDDWEEINGITHEGFNFAAGYDHFTGINAISPDTDLDGMSDVDEVFGIDTGEYDPDDITSGFGNVQTNPGNEDTDDDGAKDADEITRIKYYHPYITDPNNPDTDGDQLKDGDELKIDYYPYIDFNTDDNFDANDDGDFLDTDAGDFINKVDRTNPRLYDSDHDTLPDGWEGTRGGTTDLSLIGQWVKDHPAESYAQVLLQFLDTDNSGEIGPEDNYPEFMVFLVNPLNGGDRYEDPDSDGLNNWEEYLNNTDPLSWDTDGDTLPDGWEIKYSKMNLDPTRPDTDANDIYDDEDGDGNSDVLEEIINGLDDDGDGRIDEEYDSNDANEDFDKDGMFYYMYQKVESGWEYKQFYHPFTTYYEYYWGWSNDDDPYHEITTDPNERDSDGDMLPDGWEIWVSDHPYDEYNKSIYDDNDGLAKGWEDLFNGSMGLFPLDYVPYFLTQDATYQATYRGTLDSTKTKTDSKSSKKNDGEEDYDKDGFNNSMEYKYHTDPTYSQSNPNTIGIPIHGRSARSVDDVLAEESSEFLIADINELPEIHFEYTLSQDSDSSDIDNKITEIKEAPIFNVQKQKKMRD